MPSRGLRQEWARDLKEKRIDASVALYAADADFNRGSALSRWPVAHREAGVDGRPGKALNPKMTKGEPRLTFCLLTSEIGLRLTEAERQLPASPLAP